MMVILGKVRAKLMQEKIVEGFGGCYEGYKLPVNPAETTLYDVYAGLLKMRIQLKAIVKLIRWMKSY